jgi:hypothetical protein
MITLVVGLLILVAVLYAVRVYATADPRRVAELLRKGGGYAALGTAAYLTVTGRFYAGLPLAILGASLLDWLPGPASIGARLKRTPGQVSRVRSPMVEMELDHDTGALRGRILAGQYENVPLDALDRATLLALRSGFDAESLALLEAYLDRRESGWREHVDKDAGAGEREPPRGGPMTEEEALQILGLEPGAGALEIGRAHRSLMKKLHPDQGGSTYLAARVNEAKEVLLRRHR